jgi:hypothetical protein
LEKWKTLDGSPVKVEIPNWLTIPSLVVEDFLGRCNEYGIKKICATVDLLRNSPYWQNRKIGIAKFLRQETFLKLHDGSYDWNPDNPKQSIKSAKSKGCYPVHEADQKKFDAWDTEKKF